MFILTLGGNYTGISNPDDTRNTANWTTNANAASNNGSGLAFNWENVVTNSTTSTGSGYFDIRWEANRNYTIGRGFLFNDSFDLSLTNNGLTGLDITSTLGADAFTNWRLIMQVDGLLYQYNQQGNYYSGDGATQTLTGVHTSSNWVNINNTGISGIDGTHGTSNPDLQGNSGIIQFGFIQWGAASSGSISSTDTRVEIQEFQVDITYDAVPEPATFALLIGAAGLCFTLIRRCRK